MIGRGAIVTADETFGLSGLQETEVQIGGSESVERKLEMDLATEVDPVRLATPSGNSSSEVGLSLLKNTLLSCRRSSSSLSAVLAILGESRASVTVSHDLETSLNARTKASSSAVDRLNSPFLPEDKDITNVNSLMFP